MANTGGLRRVVGIAAAVLLTPATAFAQDLPGFVTRVTSGDRVEFRAADRRIAVQLADVVAPAEGHPLADASRIALADLCLSQAATLTQTGTANDGTVLGQLTCAGKSAAQEQVRRGMAEVRPRILADDTLLQDALSVARRARRGLWGKQDKQPRAPRTDRTERRAAAHCPNE